MIFSSKHTYDNHQQVDSIYLDIQKAFDAVSHNKLLIKLWEAGITGSAWKFLNSYLSDCRQCVVIDGNPSEWLPVTSGVLQGSILCPLLFIVYINDLPSFLLYMYADDTKCCRHVLSPTDSFLLASNVTYMSTRTQNELIEEHIILQDLVDEIKAAKFYSIIISS